jgi:hypothetical protein
LLEFGIVDEVRDQCKTLDVALAKTNFFHDTFRACRVAPKIGVGGLLTQVFYFFFAGSDVKDTSLTAPTDFSNR